MRKLAIYTLLAAAALFQAGCATISPEEMKADIKGFELPKLPENGKAIVYVVRPKTIGALIRFNVFVDDKEPDSEMGYTRGAQYIYFNLKPGTHEILSKAENWANVEVSASAGDIIFIEQIPSMGLIMARNSMELKPEYEGKYHVKHLKMGTIKKTDK